MSPLRWGKAREFSEAMYSMVSKASACRSVSGGKISDLGDERLSSSGRSRQLCIQTPRSNESSLAIPLLIQAIIKLNSYLRRVRPVVLGKNADQMRLGASNLVVHMSGGGKQRLSARHCWFDNVKAQYLTRVIVKWLGHRQCALDHRAKHVRIKRHTNESLVRLGRTSGT
jgi:hypothetical protein